MTMRLSATLLLAIALMLTACGYKLRGAPSFAFDTITVAAAQGGPVAAELRRALGDRLVASAPAAPTAATHVTMDILLEQREKTVVGVNPPVVAASEGAGQSVCVSFKTKAADQKLLRVGATIAIGVGKVVNVRDAERDDAFAIWQQPDGDVQTISKRGNRARAPICSEIAQDLDAISTGLVCWRREWIFARLG